MFWDREECEEVELLCRGIPGIRGIDGIGGALGTKDAGAGGAGGAGGCGGCGGDELDPPIPSPLRIAHTGPRTWLPDGLLPPTGGVTNPKKPWTCWRTFCWMFCLAV